MSEQIHRLKLPAAIVEQADRAADAADISRSEVIRKWTRAGTEWEGGRVSYSVVMGGRASKKVDSEANVNDLSVGEMTGSKVSVMKRQRMYTHEERGEYAEREALSVRFPEDTAEVAEQAADLVQNGMVADPPLGEIEAEAEAVEFELTAKGADLFRRWRLDRGYDRHEAVETLVIDGDDVDREDGRIPWGGGLYPVDPV